MRAQFMAPLIRRAALAVLLAAGLLAIALPGVAMAHDEFLGSDPASGSTVNTAPRTIELEFSASVKPTLATVTVTSADGRRWEDGAAVVEGAKVRVNARTDGPAGAYTVAYRIVSSDGHPVTGTTTYTVAASAAAPSVAAAAPEVVMTSTPPPNVEAAPAAEQSSRPLWPWIAGGALLIGVAVVLVYRTGRRHEE